MAVMKLKKDSTEITFDPSEGYKKPNDSEINRYSSINGTEYSYKRYVKKLWEIPLEFIPSADAVQINTWWEDIEQLQFYPDLINAPSTYYNIRIWNNSVPLDSFRRPRWEDYFDGDLILRQI